MNAQEKAIYRDQLQCLAEDFKSVVPKPMGLIATSVARSRFDLPSAAQRNVAGVLEDSVLAAEKGLSDEQVRGMSMAMHLAYLVASESGTVAGLTWDPDYRRTLERLGWKTSINTLIYNADLKKNTAYDDVLGRIAEIIGCHSTAPLAKKAVARLEQNPAAHELLKKNSKITGNQHGFVFTPMPSLGVDNEMRFGAAYSRAFYVNGKPTLGSSPSGVFLVGSAMLFKLEAAKFEMMLETVEPALREFSRRKFEEIRL